jgi:aldose 1-epimerase
MMHTLRNARGMRVAIDAHDASVRSWWAPDRYGRLADVLGAAPPAARASTGWQCAPPDDGHLLLRLTQDGLSVRLAYRLDDDGSLHLDCDAAADTISRFALAAPRFNLQGRNASVGDHVLRLAADHYWPGGHAGGSPLDVAGSAFDFRQPAPLGSRLAWPALAQSPGFRHDFYWTGSGQLHEAARVADPASGRVLRFSSTQDGCHLYSDARCFSLLAQGVQLLPGQAMRLKLAYRLGVQDLDAFDISEPVSMMSNK